MADPDAIRYLRIAQADLAEAQRMVECSGFRDSSIGFLLQQACEKALKSWIHSRGGLAPFTHDLVALMDWLEESGTDLSPFERIADLSFFAIQTRYDDSLEIISTRLAAPAEHHRFAEIAQQHHAPEPGQII
jgi:HEPN domain-containing protein